MIALPWLWAAFTVFGAAAQTARNATQRELTAVLGTVGATHVRFLFGLPFALLFLAAVCAVTGTRPPMPRAEFWPWIVTGAVAQILATALMLAAMNDRSFVVTIAYTKTEPVQTAIFGLVLLGDRLTWPLAAAILIASAGVFLMSWKPGQQTGGMRPVLLGIASGGLFGLAAVSFRGAILSLDTSFVPAATFALAVSLAIQTALLTLYLAAARPGGARRDLPRLEAVDVRRPHGRDRLGILVPGLRADLGRQRAHARPGGGAVRAGRLDHPVPPGHHRARGASGIVCVVLGVGLCC